MVKIDDELKKKALLYLCDHDESPNKDIENALNVDGSSISRVLVKLESEGYIISKFGRNNEKLRSLKPDFPALEKLVLKGTYLRGHASKSMFAKSKYCDWWIPELVNKFAASLPDLGLSMGDICQDGLPDLFEASTTKRQSDDAWGLIVAEKDTIVSFNDDNLKQIRGALHTNWSMLRFIVYYLSVNNETRKELMRKICHDAYVNNPSAEVNAIILEIIESVEDNPRIDSNLLRDKVEHILGYSPHTFHDMVDLYHNPTTKPPGDPIQRMWFFSLFQQIENMRSRYPFLYDD